MIYDHVISRSYDIFFFSTHYSITLMVISTKAFVNLKKNVKINFNDFKSGMFQ